ncbi:MarR family transcriptional regulator [Mucilaginibacter mali]|uniref:MarR family transcriptional regulator n=1 Tax=Mucilaginibacter mali TaxID=2740462 RepID=A0A7D4QAZ6_9SPHI|nr:MarR family transcriptional regulator [Mucilaginibacter mali]QKJ31225.1 MarR family transcriptional regulator [Mucilaginibacter mali]
MQPSEKLNDILFYTLEKAIKTYRQFAQKNITKAGFDITIDQWLVLKTLQQQPGIAQQEIAAMVFKDFASVTRIIELLVTKGYLNRSAHATDKRRSNLTLTDKGNTIIKDIQPLIMSNRKRALEGISGEESDLLNGVLNKLTGNCQSSG